MGGVCGGGTHCTELRRLSDLFDQGGGVRISSGGSSSVRPHLALERGPSCAHHLSHFWFLCASWTARAVATRFPTFADASGGRLSGCFRFPHAEDQNYMKTGSTRGGRVIRLVASRSGNASTVPLPSPLRSRANVMSVASSSVIFSVHAPWCVRVRDPQPGRPVRAIPIRLTRRARSISVCGFGAARL